FGRNDKDSATIRANNPIPSQSGIFYFEASIINKGKNGYML
ncbi:9188_t:CDS:1, partial [Dentiscutata erythropus]